MQTNFEMIARLYEASKTYGYKPGWVYNNFILNVREEVTINDFKDMAKILGYKPGWAHIKFGSWIDDLEEVKRQKAESFRRYMRDKRHSDGKDIEVNKDF